jgi:hypothetical protein
MATSWCHRGFYSLVYMQLYDWYETYHTTFLWATCCLMCFIPIVKPISTHWSWLLVVPLTWCRNRNQGRCDRSTGDAYSSLAPDSTSGVSRDPCKSGFYCGLWLRIFKFTWLDALIVTADCSLCLIWTHWFCLLITAFEMGLLASVTGRQGYLLLLGTCSYLWYIHNF